MNHSNGLAAAICRRADCKTKRQIRCRWPKQTTNKKKIANESNSPKDKNWRRPRPIVDEYYNQTTAERRERLLSKIEYDNVLWFVSCVLSVLFCHAFVFVDSAFQNRFFCSSIVSFSACRRCHKSIFRQIVRPILFPLFLLNIFFLCFLILSIRFEWTMKKSESKINRRLRIRPEQSMKRISINKCPKSSIENFLLEWNESEVNSRNCITINFLISTLFCPETKKQKAQEQKKNPTERQRKRNERKNLKSIRKRIHRKTLSYP